MTARIDIKIPEAEKKAFIAALPERVPASQVIRELIRNYVKKQNR